ncbi:MULTISPECIES: type II toxin-antitoxin system VapB family antitoxin [Cupriavidus]
MRTVSIFRNNANQAIRIPKDMQFEGVTELEIRRDGDTILLRPVRPSWVSFAGEPLADDDFLAERPPVVQTGRFDLSDADEKKEATEE